MLIVAGTNHRYSPIAIREKLSFSQKKIPAALMALVAYPKIKAGVILSTCNRVELYADTEEIATGIKTLKGFLAVGQAQALNEIEAYLYIYIGKEAIRHLFQVACGLDSQIIGESQIAEQVELAYRQAQAVQATNGYLDFIFQEALRVSLRVRCESGISKGDVSLASIVLELIKNKCSQIKDKRILIIGLGKIAVSVAGCLKQEQVKTVFITNRNYEKAKELARDMSAEVVRFEQLREKLRDSDIIISATASPHLILKKEDLARVKKPLLIIDLAVPRDVEPEIKYIEGITLFCLDDLDDIIEQSLNFRSQCMPVAREIIKQEVEKLCLRENLKSEPELALWH